MNGRTHLLLTIVMATLGAGTVEAADPALLGWWKLNDGEGTTIKDSSGKDNGGTIVNPGGGLGVAGSVWAIDPERGVVLSFNGDNATGAYVNAGSVPPMTAENGFTWSFWAKQDPAQGVNNDVIVGNRYGGPGNLWIKFTSRFFEVGSNAAAFAIDHEDISTDVWMHHAIVKDGTSYTYYRDGVVAGSNTITRTTDTMPFFLGGDPQGERWRGYLSDVRIYDRALSAEEVMAAMLAQDSVELAQAPDPDDQATDVPRDMVLSWEAGKYAATHDVYLATVFDDVNTAGRADPRGVLVSQGQGGVTYDPPELLAFNQTYYWRIDEVNAPPTSTVFKGEVWSFTTEPFSYPVANVVATAPIPAAPGSEVGKCVDGSGVNDNDQHSTDITAMWQANAVPGQAVWLQFEFDRVYRLDRMLVWNYNMQYESFLGFGLKGVTLSYSADGIGWTTLGDYELAQAPGLATYGPETIDLAGAAAKYVRFDINSNYGGGGYGLSEVRFYSVPTYAREPHPAPGTANVSPGVVLSWRPGREAASHEVRIGTDGNAVADGSALVGTVTVPSYDTAALDLLLDETYYWQIIEVNEAAAPRAWASDLWDFNTPVSIVVDDFETYNDDEGNRLFDVWMDGYEVATNGSQVGHDQPPYAELSNVRSGRQSMPLAYANTGAATTSEATLTLGAAQDWTRAGVQTLGVSFRGSLGSAAAQLYVKVNNGPAVNYPGSASSLAAPVWKQWNIDLAALGNAARSVRTLTLGVSGPGSGRLYIDNVRLYRSAPPATGAAADPGTANLVAYYAMEDNANDGTANGYHGTAQVGSSFGPGPAGYGRAIVLDGTSGYVDLPIGSVIASLTDATFASWVNFTNVGGGWERVFDFGTGTTNYVFLAPRQGTNGPMTVGIRTPTVNEMRVVAPDRLGSGWHHVAVVVDSATMTVYLYLDGGEVASNTTTVLPKDLGQTTQNWLGRSQWTADAYFNGSLDEFRIYDRALSAGEIQYLAGDR